MYQITSRDTASGSNTAAAIGTTFPSTLFTFLLTRLFSVARNIQSIIISGIILLIGINILISGLILILLIS